MTDPADPAKSSRSLLNWLKMLGRKPPIVRVLNEGLMRAVFQPLVDLKTGKIFAYEALLRSTSPAFDSPLTMFKAAVDAGIVADLGRAVRKLSVEGASDCPLFLNIHPSELNEPLLVQPDDPIFWHTQPVFVEITEAVPLSHFELCQSVLSEIRGKGVHLAIDDLGAGYSNLKYIADLTPDIVKIDRALVAGLTDGKRHRQLMRSIVEMCDDMGARVVAEGIETMDELHAVQDTGAELGQGYLLARPAFPPPDVAWPEERKSSGRASRKR